MTCVLDLNIGDLNRGMALKERSYELPIPRPVVLCIAGRVYARKASSRLNIVLERALLAVVKQIACRVQEDDCFVLGKVLVSKDRRILAGINGKLIVLA